MGDRLSHYFSKNKEFSNEKTPSGDDASSVVAGKAYRGSGERNIGSEYTFTEPWPFVRRECYLLLLSQPKKLLCDEEVYNSRLSKDTFYEEPPGHR